MIRPAILFTILLALVLTLLSASLLVGAKSGELDSRLIGPFKKFAFDLSEALKEQPTPPRSTVTITSSSSSEIKINLNDTRPVPPTNPPKAAPPPPPARECYRYTVTHLDGSTSRLCYSYADYNQLLSLGSNLSSAKTFYQFHLDGAQRYQDEYDRDHSILWLDAKASQQKQAEREKEKIGSVTLQMQAIEQRGY